jgi:DNA-binding response OmpR family regulator
LTQTDRAEPTHVLVVEDSSLVADALRLLLEEYGYRVTMADSLATARASVRELSPDVVLLDLALPDGNGLSLAQDWITGDGPAVIALTGSADEETRSRCLDAGCKLVLVKPVTAADLLEQLALVQP